MCVCVEFGYLADISSPTLLYSITSFVQVLCQKIRIHYLLAKHRTGIPAGSTLQISRLAWNIRRRNDFCITNIIDDTLYKHRYNIR